MPASQAMDCPNSMAMNTVEELLKQFRSQLNITTSSFYAWKNINDLAASDDEIFLALKPNVLSWNIIVQSLQITFFTALGGMFNKDSRSLTVSSFLSQCQAEIGVLSNAVLEAQRRDDPHGAGRDYPDVHPKRVYERVRMHFLALEQAVNQYQTTYNDNYEPIRRKLIGDKEFAAVGFTNALYVGMRIEELEEILRFLRQLESVVTELHMNGQITNLNDYKVAEDRHVREDVEKLLRKLAMGLPADAIRRNHAPATRNAGSMPPRTANRWR